MIKKKTDNHIMKCSIFTVFLMGMLSPARLDAQNTLKLCPSNHHYLMYQEKPVILITSAEHYGALINLNFNYLPYLNALHKEGMNNTRIFSGTYVERKTDIKFMQYGNTLAPQPGSLICPWERSNTPGYANGGNKFDLDKWNERYFSRIKDILKQAAKRKIMVEFTLFGNQYSDGIYSYSPLYPDNNIQGVGIKRKNGFLYFQSLKDSALVARQDAMVIKIVKELNKFNNLYYEISNEPYNEVKDSSLVDKWHVHIAALIRETEKSLPKKHLIASDQAIVDNSNIDIANYHYVHISNIPGFDSLLRLNKVISMDETMGSLKDANPDNVRVEAWDFILHGGGAYDNLSWEYTTKKPQGTPGADTIRKYLQHLQQFIGSFDFLGMKYSPGILVRSPGKAITRVLAEKGRQYALYIHHSKPDNAVPDVSQFISNYVAEVASFHDTVTLSIPKGVYRVRWYNPATGAWYGKFKVLKHKGGDHTFYTPLFTTDIAMRISK